MYNRHLARIFDHVSNPSPAKTINKNKNLVNSKNEISFDFMVKARKEQNEEMNKKKINNDNEGVGNIPSKEMH